MFPLLNKNKSGTSGAVPRVETLFNILAFNGMYIECIISNSGILVSANFIAATLSSSSSTMNSQRFRVVIAGSSFSPTQRRNGSIAAIVSDFLHPRHRSAVQHGEVQHPLRVYKACAPLQGAVHNVDPSNLDSTPQSEGPIFQLEELGEHEVHLRKLGLHVRDALTPCFILKPSSEVVGLWSLQ